MKKKLIHILLMIIFLIFISSCNNNKNDKTNENNYKYVSEKEMSASLLIEVTLKSNNGASIKNYGSGVIFDEDENNYYCLTNNHVISLKLAYSGATYSIFDYNKNQFEGSLLYYDENYDLAILSFDKNNINLNPIEFETNDLKTNDELFSISSLSSNMNIEEKGTFIEMTNFKYDTDDSKIDFEVISHTAKIYSGSSGGMLLNNNKKLVGINFAKETINNKEIYYAIPVLKINEFINLYEKKSLIKSSLFFQ